VKAAGTNPASGLTMRYPGRRFAWVAAEVLPFALFSPLVPLVPLVPFAAVQVDGIGGGAQRRASRPANAITTPDAIRQRATALSQ
jgi:hypothetical protein